MKNIILADIDGCCLDSESRLPHFLSGDYEQYHDLYYEDKPLPQAVSIYIDLMSNPNFRFYFVTARGQSARHYTVLQLNLLFGQLFNEDHLIMGPDPVHGTLIPAYGSTVSKPELVTKFGINIQDIFLAIDDNPLVIDSWRRLQVPCMQLFLLSPPAP